jgi:hypothetical protein
MPSPAGITFGVWIIRVHFVIFGFDDIRVASWTWAFWTHVEFLDVNALA